MTTTLSKEDVYTLAQQSFGVVPGVIKEMAERSVPLAHMYVQGTQTMERTSLAAIEINAIELKISLLNNCASCVKGHSFLLKKANLPEADISAILNGQPTSNARLNILLQAAEYIYHAGHGPYPDLVLDFLSDNDISEQVIFEIIGLIALKTMSNYVNNYLHAKK